MARITRCKNLQKDMLTKDPKFGIFSDTSGRITDTYKIEWPRVYAIFDNDDFSDIQNNQLAYQRMRDLDFTLSLLDVLFSPVMTQSNGLWNMLTPKTVLSTIMQGHS